ELNLELTADGVENGFNGREPVVRVALMWRVSCRASFVWRRPSSPHGGLLSHNRLCLSLPTTVALRSSRPRQIRKQDEQVAYRRRSAATLRARHVSRGTLASVSRNGTSNAGSSVTTGTAQRSARNRHPSAVPTSYSN